MMAAFDKLSVSIAKYVHVGLDSPKTKVQGGIL